MIKIVLPNKNHQGPCFGVKLALEKCLKIKNKRRWVIYGKLAHNRVLNKYLREKGLKIIDSLDKAKNKKIVIRAHGINKTDLETILKNKVEFLDLTCPYVKNLLNKALNLEKKDYRVVIIGDKNHVEVKNVCSFLSKPVVIGDAGLVKKLGEFDMVGVVTQTTETLEKINSVLSAIKHKYKNVVYFQTRCSETDQRQKKAVEMAKKVDLMLVVGDSISANTKNLVNLCKNITKTKLIKTEKEIDKKAIRDVGSVGVIASASAPSFVVKKIIKKLDKIRQ